MSEAAARTHRPWDKGTVLAFANSPITSDAEPCRSAESLALFARVSAGQASATFKLQTSPTLNQTDDWQDLGSATASLSAGGTSAAKVVVNAYDHAIGQRLRVVCTIADAGTHTVTVDVAVVIREG